MRILLYTGKGGAGKTTVACATAIRCASLSHRTLLIAADGSQSLADCLNCPLTDDPLEIAPSLWAVDLDPLVRLERAWPGLQPILSSLLDDGLLDAAPEELTLAPGMVDLIRLLALQEACEGGEYDVVIVDAAASLPALRMLSYPEVAGWWVERLRGLSGGARDPLSEQALSLATRLARLRATLSDGASCSIRIVSTADRLTIRETQRTLTFVNLFGYNVDALVVNRQKRLARVLAETFGAWPTLCLAHYEHEPIGLPLLTEAGLALFPPPIDPAAVMLPGQAQRLTREAGGYVLSLKLPFIHEGDIDVLQHHGQLILQVGRIRRVVRLPEPVAALTAADAVLEDGTLEVHLH